MPDIVYGISGITTVLGLILYFGTMFALSPQREKLRSIGERTFPDKYQPVLYVWPGSWCTPLAFSVTFFRWFGAKTSVTINQLARQELGGTSYWLLVINAVAMVAALSGSLPVFIIEQAFDLTPPWER